MGLIGGIARRIGRALLDLAVLLVVVLILPGIPPNVKYSYYELDETLPFEGPLAKNVRLNEAGRLLDGKINGPESIASRRPNELFTSLHSGNILRIWGKRFDHFQKVAQIGPGCDGPWQESKCGRPLGLRFAPDGRLIVVDAYLGLFSVDVDTGEKERIVDPSVEIDGLVPKIPDDLDIDEDGNIYWSDASTVGDLSDGLVEMYSDPSGRIIKYDSKTKTNTVLVKNVHFANGVQLSPDRDFVLFCETFRSRVLRHWLNGPNAGKTDVFVDRLPGKPDNLRARKEGGYYVSLVAVDDKTKVDIGAIVAKLPLLRKLILRLFGIPKLLFETITKIYPNQYTENFSYKIFHLQPVAELIASKEAVVVEVDEEGNITGSLQGDNGEVRFISETEQVGDYLFFGSPYNNYLGYLRVSYTDEEEEPPSMEVDGESVRMVEKQAEVQEEVEAQPEDAEEVKDQPEVKEEVEAQPEVMEEVKDQPEVKEVEVQPDVKEEVKAESEIVQETKPEQESVFPLEDNVEVKEEVKVEPKDVPIESTEQESKVETGKTTDESRAEKPPSKIEL